MAMFVVKAHLSTPEGSVETRRFPISSEAASSPGLFKVVHEKIGNTFADLKNKHFSLMWKDSDGDFVLMSTDPEIQDAVSTIGSSPLQVYIQVEGDKTVKTTKLTEASKAMDSKEMQKDNNDKQEEDGMECQEFPIFSVSPGMMYPPPPPPFPFHPFHWPGADSCKGRWNQRGPHMGGGMGFHGGPMAPGPFGMKPHRGFGRRGHPFGHNHHGRHGHHGQHHDDHGRHGHHCQHHDGTKGHHHGKCGPREGWKIELRDAVPYLHRRWAKMFIQKWRQENLANATTTTSDTGTDDELSIEKAGVPEAYRKWLRQKLPRWHKKWGAHKVSSEESGDENDKNDKKLMKSSVPKDFRKWTKWYLRRHFGRRAAPKFKGHDGEGRACRQDCMEQEGMWERSKARHFKKHILASLVPTSHRIFAKKYIHDWRVQRDLESLSAASTTTSESDEGGPGLDEEVETVPEDYGRWLGKFLPRWHRWRGLVEKPETREEKGSVGQFKDTVPMDFRAWVKHYLCRQYGRQRPSQCWNKRNEDAEIMKYRTWLKMFKEKWLEMNQMMGEDSENFTVLTSGDEGETPTFFPSDDNNGVPEKTFKRLRLSDEEEGTQEKSVQFDPATYQHPCDGKKHHKKMMKKMMKSVMDSDDCLEEMEIRKGRRKHPINDGFRKWMWLELDNWDGQSMADSSMEAQKPSQSEEVVDLPDHVSQWMFKVMKKLQKKKAKQEMKAAKRDMKAVKRAESKAARQASNSQQVN